MFGATVIVPFGFTVNGPFGVDVKVTSPGLVPTTTGPTPFKVSFIKILGVVPPETILGVSTTASITGNVTAKLVWELSFVVLAFPCETFNGVGGQTPHKSGFAAVIYTTFPKIKSGPLTTFALTINKISPTSNEPNPPPVFFKRMVFPDPEVIVNNVHLASLPAAIPIISASVPTEIVTLNEFATIVLFP